MVIAVIITTTIGVRVDVGAKAIQMRIRLVVVIPHVRIIVTLRDKRSSKGHRVTKGSVRNSRLRE
jgi:hypothetical protein